MSYSVVDLKLKNYDTIMAVGDVHGCLAKLRALTEKFEGLPGKRKALICLGDMIDRGPSSAAVLDWMLTRNDQIDKLALKGNHEQMMLDFMAKISRGHMWLKHGGLETLRSYGLDAERLLRGFRPNTQAIRQTLPQEHLEYLENLPLVATYGNTVFVHAGFNPGKPFDRQDASQLLWGPLANPQEAEQFGTKIIHGHVPQRNKPLEKWVINIDGGAVYGGRLKGLVVTLEETLIIEA